MKKIDLIALRRQVEPHRNEVVEIDGIPMPKSAVMLMSDLAAESEFNVRVELYDCAISECELANNTAAVVELARAQHQEFPSHTSLITLSRALIENNELEAGLLHAKDALETAIQEQCYVNYTAGNLVRLSVQAGSVERVNEAMEALADSTEVPRKEDCVLEADWCDKAEALGADREMISWIRSVAKTQMAHMKRRKRRLAPNSRAKT